MEGYQCHLKMHMLTKIESGKGDMLLELYDNVLLLFFIEVTHMTIILIIIICISNSISNTHHYTPEYFFLTFQKNIYLK